MAELLVRKIENGVKAKLKRPAAKQKEPAKGGLGSEIAALFSKVSLESRIPELRRVRVRPLSFDR
jgi:hypothetical protein